jgi:beta-glucosidase
VRAKALISEMTKDEKIRILYGDGASPYTGHAAAIPRLSIPNLNLNDGPQGFRYEGKNDTTTQMPAAIKVAATWSVDAALAWGETMGKEFYGKGANVQLGPGLNVNRIPLNGRNFEYLSGEDPFLGYTLVQPVVKGIQGQTVMANAKHFVDNSQESGRNDINEVVDERTQFELYYPPFEGAIEAGVGSFMCSYNKVNGKWACENENNLMTDLRDRLGFDGYVMSDWGAVHSVTDISKGLDQDMSFGGDIWNQDSLQDTPEDQLNTAAYRIIKSMMTVGIYDDKNTNMIDSVVTSPEHKAIARQINEEGIVLLKNENNALPLKMSKKQNILILGEDDLAYNARSHGTGSGAVHSTFVQPPIWEFCDKLGVKRFDDIKIPRRHCDSFRGHCITYAGSKNTHVWEIPSSLYDTAVIFIGGVMAGEDHDRP